MLNNTTILQSIEGLGYTVSPAYSDLLDHYVCDDFLCVVDCFDSLHRNMFRDVGALITRFKDHVEHELEGGEIISAISRIADDPWRERMEKHAVDEVRHHKMFGAMLHNLSEFYGVEAPEIKKINTKEVVGNFSRENGWKYLLISLHWAEVRNLFILDQYLSYCTALDADITSKIHPQIKKVFDDEMNHVAYSAEAISEFVGNSPELHELAVSYREIYIAQCWEEIGRLANYHATHRAFPAKL